VFIAALFTIAKPGNNQCPSEEDKENVAYTYNVILCNHFKQGNPAMCDQMDESSGH
jgi:hypothetical protein